MKLTDYRERFPILRDTTYLINHSLGAMPGAAEGRLLEFAGLVKRDLEPLRLRERVDVVLHRVVVGKAHRRADLDGGDVGQEFLALLLNLSRRTVRPIVLVTVSAQ